MPIIGIIGPIIIYARRNKISRTEKQSLTPSEQIIHFLKVA
jgi:hypothetical protein